MPVSGCSGAGLAAGALAALLLLPAPYLLPELRRAPAPAPAPPPPRAWLARPAAAAPPADVLLSLALLLAALLAYLAEWMQRKIMERRVVKLSSCLAASAERLRAWDAQQEQLEGTLRMVHNATTEYNLLLFLLLRQHRRLPRAPAPPAPSSPGDRLDKDLGGDLDFLKSSAEA